MRRFMFASKINPISVRRFTVSGTSTVKLFIIRVRISPMESSLNIPCPRMVTALVIFTALNAPDERLITSPSTAAAWACCRAFNP